MPVLDASLALKGPAGVTLDGAGVTALHLKGRGISGVDASLARACPSLAKLDLSDNVVRAGASVDALSRLSSLKNLNLANNDLDGAALAPLGVGASDAPDGGGGGAPQRKKPRANGDLKRKGDDAPITGTGLLPNLRVLNVSGNRLDALDGVRGAPNLGALIANENALESLEPIRGLRALNTVVASSNRIETVGDELRDLALLAKLSLSHNRIETLPGSALARCGALRELRLAHNRLKSLPPKLSACENLRVLDLSHNKFENWGDVAAIANLPKLQQLSMRGCPLASRPGYAETAAKMCESLRALDGRKIGPGGWVDPLDAADDRGARRGAHQGAEDADAFAAARRAAGLDPLSEPEDDEDDEMDEEERAMAEEVKALRRRARAEDERRGDGYDGNRDGNAAKKTRKKTKKSEDSRAKDDGLPRAGVSDEPGAEGTSFLQEMVARNVGKSRTQGERGVERARRGGRDGGANGRRCVVEVRGSRAPVGVATGRDALMAAAAENARGSAWGVDDDDWRGGGWGDDPADRRERRAEREGDSDSETEEEEETRRGRRRGDGRGNAGKKKRAMSTEKTRKKRLNVRRYA